MVRLDRNRQKEKISHKYPEQFQVSLEERKELSTLGLHSGGGRHCP